MNDDLFAETEWEPPKKKRKKSSIETSSSSSLESISSPTMDTPKSRFAGKAVPSSVNTGPELKPQPVPSSMLPSALSDTLFTTQSGSRFDAQAEKQTATAEQMELEFRQALRNLEPILHEETKAEFRDYLRTKPTPELYARQVEIRRKHG